VLGTPIGTPADSQNRHSSNTGLYVSGQGSSVPNLPPLSQNSLRCASEVNATTATQPSMSSRWGMSSAVPMHAVRSLPSARGQLFEDQPDLHTDSLLCAGDAMEKYIPLHTPLILNENETTWLNSGGEATDNQGQRSTEGYLYQHLGSQRRLHSQNSARADEEEEFHDTRDDMG
jgi:hypothetical protein